MKATLNPNDSLVLAVTVHHDADCESPTTWDGWRLYSFGHRHANYADPSDFICELGRSPDEVVAKPEVRAKLDSGLAHWLSYYEHGGCRWSLIGEGPQCPWDTVRFAGILVWESEPNDLGAGTVEARQSDARAFLDTYSDWCNGFCYGYSIECEGELIDSCFGFIGADSLGEAVSSAIESWRGGQGESAGKRSVTVKGEAAHALTLSNL